MARMKDSDRIDTSPFEMRAAATARVIARASSPRAWLPRPPNAFGRVADRAVARAFRGPLPPIWRRRATVRSDCVARQARARPEQAQARKAAPRGRAAGRG